MRRTIRSIRAWALGVCCILLGLHGQRALAQKASAPAHLAAVSGALLTQASKGAWLNVDAKSDIPADKLLVALFGAEFNSPKGGVNARLIADIGQRGPFPVLEGALRFHAPGSADLDITLERGILVLTNTKSAGAALVRIRLRSEQFEIKLSEPKGKLGIEVYGRHLPGPPNVTDAKADDPIANIAFFALQGDSVVATDKHATRLQAPPGGALYVWDNVSRAGEVVDFETLPESVKPMSVEERKQFEAICGFAKSWASDPASLGKGIEQSAFAKGALERKAAVVALGALDDLPRLLQVLNHKDHADAREAAIVVVRSWLGREPGQSIRMYDYLTKAENLTPTQAKNLLHLFNGFTEERRRQPDTYELLIQALNHSRLLARELAHWHLVRLAPAGKSIPYDAAGSDDQRREAVAAWQRLIPAGQLPPPPAQKSTTK